MNRKLLAMLMAVCILVTALIPLQTAAAETVTRSEWISSLVSTFEMTVEEDAAMPDNYFGDITSDMTCYQDILLAVEFGVIALDAGEDFRPDDTVTREFAAQTLNHCLNFQLEDNPQYTYSEASTVTYPDDIQVAVNRGWFTLSGTSFLPEQAVTQAEADAMLADAKTVLASDVIDTSYNSQYEFIAGVIEIPQTANVSIAEDYTVTVTDYTPAVKTGDIFVVYASGFPVALKATKVATNGNITTISSTTEGTDGAITSADGEGSIEVDMESFEAVEVETFSVTDTANAKNEDMTVQLQSISYNKNTKTLTAKKDIKIDSGTAGAIIVTLKNLKLHYKENAFGGNYEAYITAQTSVTKSIDFDFGSYADLPSRVTLGYVNIAGVGKISLSIELSLKGGLSATEEGSLTAGFSYTRRDGFRLIKNYHKTSYSFTAEAEANVGLILSADVDLVFVKGSIWVTVGVRGRYKYQKYDTGKPLECETISVYLYANIGASATIDYVLDKKTYRKTYDIYTEKKQPRKSILSL